jgi:hypothetical protein
MKKQLKKYYQKTPKNWRRIGDYLLWCSAFVMGYSVYSKHEIIGMASLSLGVIGKALTNFKTETKNES